MHVKNGDKQTDGKRNSRSRMGTALWAVIIEWSEKATASGYEMLKIGEWQSAISQTAFTIGNARSDEKNHLSSDEAEQDSPGEQSPLQRSGCAVVPRPTLFLRLCLVDEKNCH